MAPNNIRTLHGKKQLPKLSASSAILPASEEGNLLASSSTGLVDAGIILGVIPYPVALWSFDRRSCIFNHPTRELLGFSEEEFMRRVPCGWNGSKLKMAMVFNGLGKTSGGGEKGLMSIVFFRRSKCCGRVAGNIYCAFSSRARCVRDMESLYQETAVEDEFTGGYSLRNYRAD